MGKFDPAARVRGLALAFQDRHGRRVGGVEALVGVGPWTEPMRFTRAADR